MINKWQNINQKIITNEVFLKTKHTKWLFCFFSYFKVKYFDIYKKNSEKYRIKTEVIINNIINN